MSVKVYLSKRYQLPALHQLKNERFSEEKNLKTFGACSRLHGHSYEIEVTVAGELDPGSGLLISGDELDRIVRSYIIDPFIGTNLSNHFSHTTGEALAIEFYGLLSERFSPPTFLSKLTVNETAKNSFTVARG